MFKKLKMEFRAIRLLEELHFERKMISYIIRQYRGTGLFSKISQQKHDEHVILHNILSHQIKRLEKFYKKNFGKCLDI